MVLAEAERFVYGHIVGIVQQRHIGCAGTVDNGVAAAGGGAQSLDVEYRALAYSQLGVVQPLQPAAHKGNDAVAPVEERAQHIVAQQTGST